MKAHVCFLFLAAIIFSTSIADELDLKNVQAQAAQGNELAEYELGKAYQLGHGVPQDFVKAADLYRKAAAQGNAKSMYNLGYIYLHGQGVAVDNLAAFQWFQKSADLGLAAAELQVGLFYFFGDMGITRDYAAANKWLTLAVQQENVPEECAPAANALGTMSEHGLGLPKDGKKAVYWYTKAAEMGNARAQSNLGRLLVEGILVPKDLVQGYMWLKLSTDQRDVTALHLLPDYLSAKMFSDAQLAEGDRKVMEFEAKERKTGHHVMLSPVANTNSSAAANPGTSPSTNSATTPGQNSSGH